jgi:hypothetical protein
MLYGVLRMPYDLTMASELSRRQFYSRVQEAASRLEAAEARLAEIDATSAPMVAREAFELWFSHHGDPNGYVDVAWDALHAASMRGDRPTKGGDNER